MIDYIGFILAVNDIISTSFYKRYPLFPPNCQLYERRSHQNSL